MNMFKKSMKALAIGAALFFAVGCSSETGRVSKKIDISELKSAKLDTGFVTNLSVIKAYPATGKCDGSAEHPNVYICRNKDSGDTLYVFELCKKVSAFAADDSRYKDHFCIINNKALTSYPVNIHVDLPAGVDISKNCTYVFANMFVLTE